MQLQNNNKFNCGAFELHFLHFYQNIVKKIFLIVLSGSNTQYLHEKSDLPIPDKPVNGCIITVKNPAVLYHHTQWLVYKKKSTFYECK